MLRSAAGAWVALFFTSLLSVSHALSNCKTLPESVSLSQWGTLNNSIEGNLLHPSPPGAPCHPAQPTFDNSTCAYVSSQWTNSTFHSNNPISADYNDESCFPDVRAPCSRFGYPLYVVNASKAEHVKQGVIFAKRHNIRLIVKGTGHDFAGRSSAPNSLSIWTHHIQGISFHDSFVPKHCKTCKPTPAATIQAGMRMSEINAESAKLGVVVVGGADAGVGIGGFITGGGHSPISSKYGLGADQVLEFQVVTATGAILTVNECQHSDLFWALRGGGGSTFAVIISATVKTYPSPAITSYVFAINTTADSDAFADAHAYFHSQLPRLSEGGMMGYYYGLPNVGESEPDVTKRAKILGAFILLDQPASDAERLTRPMVEYYQNHTSSGAEITMSGYIQSFPDFYSWWVTNPPGAVGTSGRLGSRLLGGEALTGNQTALKRALRLSTPTPNVLLGHLVAGKGVREAKPAGGEDAVHPAWRKAYTHIILPTSWELLNTTQKEAATSQLTNERVAALRDIAPTSGAYVNEADPDEPNWQQAFWGTHYPRLYSIKQRWDPSGVFYCHPCVGSELWTLVNGTVCRV